MTHFPSLYMVPSIDLVKSPMGAWEPFIPLVDLRGWDVPFEFDLAIYSSSSLLLMILC